MSPARICSGTSTAATVSAERSTSGAAGLAVPRSCRSAVNPAIRKVAVNPEASSMWVSR